MDQQENLRPRPSSDRSEPAEELNPGVSRRGFLGGLGTAAAAMAVGTVGLEAVAASPAGAAEVGPLGEGARREAAFVFRRNAATFHRKLDWPAHPCNGDEALYPSKIGNFSKGLPHNGFGEVDTDAYASLLKALSSGNPSDFEDIQLGLGAKLTNPQAGLAFDLEGADSHELAQPPAPSLSSAEEASEMVELYWMARLRDVRFDTYATNAVAAQAAAELTAQGASFKGPKVGGAVTAQTLFRDIAPGVLDGPYLSQFMILPTPFGTEFVDRRSRVYLPGTDRMTTVANWLNVQNGGTPFETQDFDPQRRYLRNGRDLSQWVHIDVLFQAYFNACLTMLTPPNPSDAESSGLGVPFNAGNPYHGSLTQIGFGTFGPPGIKALLCEVASRALKAVWFQKWFVHRRLRPEAFAGLVHFQKTTNRYPGVLHNKVLNSQAAQGVFDQNGTYLLPMAFPEGSPTHPAYGAGHATVAGACVTILKAVFDENFVIDSSLTRKVASDGLSLEPLNQPLTIRGELNKVASNIATGRNIAGVHWRSDAFYSLRLGQAIAVNILRDQRAGFNEVFNGYTFTGFDGETITV